MKVISFTHNDFDGLGCVISFLIKFKPEKFFFTNYHDMDQVVKDIIQYKREHDSDTLVIGDLSFTDNPKALSRLCQVFKNNVLLIDHHMHPEGFFDEHPIHTIIDTSKSATALCWERLHLDRIEDENIRAKMKNFVDLVDTFDMWRDTSPNFDHALYADALFAALKTDNDSLVSLGRKIISYEFSIFEDLESFSDAYKANYYAYMADLLRRKLLWVNHEIGLAFIFGDEYFPKAVIDLFRRDISVVVGVKYGIFRVRISKHAGWTDEQLNDLRQSLTGMTDYCHLNAFTYESNCFTEQEIVDECKKISDNIYRIRQS